MSVRTLLDRLLEPGGLTLMMQPIFELRGEQTALHAVECLMRGPGGTNIEPAGVLFNYVRRKQQEVRVDHMCVDHALNQVGGVDELRASRIGIHLNVHASTLERDRRFVTRLRRLADRNEIAAERLTVEISEHHPVSGPSFQRALDELRGAGVRIALDDVGQGYTTYRLILDSRPDYLKVDSYLVHGISGSPERQAVLESLALLAERLSLRMVVEGVEDAVDLVTLRSLGIELVQGYLLSPPLSLAAWRERSFAMEPLPTAI